MTALAEKFASEPTEAHLITNTFALAGYQALETHHLADLYRSPVYLYALKPVTNEAEQIAPLG